MAAFIFLVVVIWCFLHEVLSERYKHVLACKTQRGRVLRSLEEGGEEYGPGKSRKQTAWPWIKVRRLEGKKESGAVMMGETCYTLDFFSEFEFDIEVFQCVPKLLGKMLIFIL